MMYKTRRNIWNFRLTVFSFSFLFFSLFSNPGR